MGNRRFHRAGDGGFGERHRAGGKHGRGQGKHGHRSALGRISALVFRVSGRGLRQVLQPDRQTLAGRQIAGLPHPQIDFRLTPGDFAQGDHHFEIVHQIGKAVTPCGTYVFPPSTAFQAGGRRLSVGSIRQGKGEGH
ncbi:MAG: hypothetical protein CL534_08990 [Ahrensia sp.]|nr:hypothetical protein [Ahrensia sp.]